MAALATAPDSVLSKRWYPLRDVEAQLAYWNSPHRFNVVPAGRRSGKTERLKRKIIRRALSLQGITHSDTPRFFAGAPTRDQAKRIFWDDLKKLSKPYWGAKPRETELTITLWTGAEICVLGLDEPARIEGTPWDGGGLDEYGNMKPTAWTLNVRPALSTPGREGWCDLIGVPEGRNHYYDIAMQAKADMIAMGDKSEWGYYHWFSSAVLDPKEIEAARRDLDTLSFEQEYEGSFVNFSGRAYYEFTDDNKARLRDRYAPLQPLILCLDFNVAPGVAVVVQELPLPGKGSGIGSAIIGEVHIPSNSSTPAVCRRLLKDWGDHRGRVEVYGDQTGGARGTAKVLGSDWDLAKGILTKGTDDFRGFGSRVEFHIKSANPSERARVNAVNSRTRSAAGLIRLMVDPVAAPYTVKDFEGVTLLEGGSGEIDKKKNPKLTHWSDAFGYYCDYRFPVAEAGRWGESNFTVGG